MSTQGSSRMVDSQRGPEPGEAYGAAGLTQKLRGIHFPISKQELLQQHGNESFQWTKGGKSYTLRDCLQDLPERIESITQITEAVSDFHENEK